MITNLVIVNQRYTHMQSPGPKRKNSKEAPKHEISIYYDRSIELKELSPYLPLLYRCLAGKTQHGDNLEKLKGGNVYSARTNIKGRILLKFELVNGQRSLIVLEILPNHKYRKSKYLRLNLKREIGNQLTSLEENADLEFKPVTTFSEVESQSHAISSISPTPVFNHKGNYIVFNKTQETASGSKLPLLVEGPPGSGKTSIALDIIQNSLEDNKNILYVTQSSYLANDIRQQFDASLSKCTSCSVYFKTYSDLMRNRASYEIKDKGQDIFKDWFSGQKIKSTNVSKDFCLQPDLIYQEFRIISGYHLSDYLSQAGIGRKQCIYQKTDERRVIAQLYGKWLNYLSDNNFTLPEFDSGPNEEEKGQYDLVIVDESQDLSHGQLKNLVEYAKTYNIVYCLDRKQNLSDENPKRIYIEKLLNNQAMDSRPTIINLQAHYRCPSVIMDFAVVFDDIRKSFNTKNKTEHPIVKASEAGGALIWVNPFKNKKEMSQIKAMQNNVNVCVITQEHIKKDAQMKFGMAQVFTPAEVKGLEFDTIVLYNILSENVFCKINTKLKNKVKDSTTNENLNCSAALSSCFVAATRAKKRLYMVQEESGRLSEILSLLKSKVPAKTAELSSNAEKKSTSKDWHARADKYAAMGLLQQSKDARSKANDLANEEPGHKLEKVTVKLKALTIENKKKPTKIPVNKKNINRKKQRRRKTAIHKRKGKGNSKARLKPTVKNGQAQRNGGEALLLAAKDGKISKCRRLIKNDGINVNYVNKDGVTALHIATQHGHENICKLLLSAKAKVNLATTKDNCTALHLAAQEGYSGICNLFIRHQADVNIIGSQNGESALQRAAQYGHVAACKSLIEKSNINHGNQRGWTALHMAAQDGYKEICQMLCDTTGIDINASSLNGETPLHLAVIKGQVHICKILLENVNVNANATNKNGWSALHTAVYYDRKEIFQMLIKQSVDVNAFDKFGDTAFHIAARKRNTRLCKILLDSGFNMTPLYNAVKQGNVETCRLLIASGINLNTVRSLTIEKNQNIIAEMLLVAFDKDCHTSLNIINANLSEHLLYSAEQNTKTSSAYLPSGGLSSNQVDNDNVETKSHSSPSSSPRV